MWLGPIATAMTMCAFTVLLSSQVAAAALELEKCKELKAEHASMVADKMEQTLGKMRDGVGDTLDAEQLKRVKEFLKIEDQLMFRCADGLTMERTPEKTEATAKSDPVPLPLRKPRVTQPKEKTVSR